MSFEKLTEELKQKFLEDVLVIERENKDKSQPERKRKIENLIQKLFNSLSEKADK